MANPAMEPLAAADAFAHPHGNNPPARARPAASRNATAEGSRWRQSDNPSFDPDTCRICRGEATPEEPLFYPCKCSGSIKYVHQDCLMEWLSHSQKKHCELCKTPFRFTKLYSPKMPSALPVHVFLGHMTKYVFRNVMVWCRAALVATVWLCWLPWLMRSVWSFLFWLSDEGLGSGSFWGGASTPRRSGNPSLEVTYADTCPANPFTTPTVNPAGVSDGIDEIMRNFSTSPYQGSWRSINVSVTNPITSALIRATLNSFSAAEPSVDATCPAGGQVASSKTSSLLGDSTFLNRLTRFPLFNRSLINVLEGQIITVLVIVCFILIILVRDYVVQQQPEINMRAAFAANENQQQQPRQEDLDRAVDEHVEGLPVLGINRDHARDLPDANTDHAGEALEGHYEQHVDETLETDDFRQPPIFRRASRDEDSPTGSSASPGTNGAAPPGFRSQRQAAASVQEYMRIHRQADGDMEKILKIIKDENLEDSLGYWAQMTQSVVDKRAADRHRREASEASQSASTSDAEPGPAHQPVHLPPPSESHLAWPADDFLKPLHNTEQSSSDEDQEDSYKEGKGKEISREDGGHITPPLPIDTEDAVYRGTSFTPLRPRAISDGPQRTEAANPLANNNWSFSALAPESPKAEEGEDGFAGAPTPRRDFPVQPSAARTGDSTEVLDELRTITADVASAQASLGPTATPSAEPTTQQEDDEPIQTPQAAEDPLPADHDEQIAEDAVVAQRPPLQRGVMDRVADFMWGDIDHGEAAGNDEDFQVGLENGVLHAGAMFEGDDEHLDLGIADDDDFEDIPEGEDMDEFDERDPEVVEAAVAAGLDPEALDDAEDIEGILELIGMRGPLVGLFQNAVFCAVLVSMAIFLCVYLPYNFGRLSVWGAMNPVRLVNILFSLTKFVQDLAVSFLAAASSSFLALMYYTGKAFGWWLPSAQRSCHSLMNYTWQLSTNATTRVVGTITSDFPIPSSVDMKTFSAVSHQALLALKAHVAAVFIGIGETLGLFFDRQMPARVLGLVYWAASYRGVVWEGIQEVPMKLLNPASWVISFGVPEAPASIPLELTVWSGTDRFWAILCGYGSLSALGALYLRRGTPFSHGQVAQEWEASLIDILNQASGVMKVILIISIEMLVFPLYCGLLLDVALLPLLEDATIKSRVAFTVNFPLTSIFVHWFVGTGYMFHFALFVSMCRKIMRKGVLYFIRDPDDPEFHPIRDVLERNVVTQLRKILFSAFVYGALVLVCLGGVVWGLALATKHVLPIHYSSNEPVLEFPIDLLFYNFAMPLAVKFFRPSDGLHAMYTWWLRKCARFLRLTWFLFGERQIDEEGRLSLHPDVSHEHLSWWSRHLLEVDEKNRVVPKTWRDTFEGGTAKPTTIIPDDKMQSLRIKKHQLVVSGQLVQDGRFVRTPASDQVKIPKGKRVFVEVAEDGHRIDFQVAGSDSSRDLPEDIYRSDQYQQVYLPPHFGTRIFLFILFIWVFAAVTGVSFTILPLIFGRKMFKMLLPAHVRTNDIYAFSIGIYILGSAGYFVFHLRAMIAKAKGWAAASLNALKDVGAPLRIAGTALQGLKLTYAYTMLLLVFPLILTSMMELYVVIPMHTWVNPPSPQHIITPANPNSDGTLPTGGIPIPASSASAQHTARVVQSWTLGLLYAKLGARAIVAFYPNSRAAAAVRAVLRRGWLRPDVGVLTRAFVVPGLCLGTLALFGPVCLTGLFERHNWMGFGGHGIASSPAPHELKTLYRLSYPAAAVSAFMVLGIVNAGRVLASWHTRIRDEAYLIGERLHNFGVVTAGATAGSGAPGPGGPNDANDANMRAREPMA